MTAYVSMMLKSRASLTCFQACFFLVGLRTYQHPGTKFYLPFRGEIFRYLGAFPTNFESLCPVFSKDHLRCHSVSFLNNLFYGVSPIRHYWLRNWLLHPPVNMFCFRTICSSLHCRMRLSPSIPEDKNQPSPTAPHTITSDARPYAPASRLNTKLYNDFSLSKTFVSTSALFSVEVDLLSESFAPHCTYSPNSPHLFQTM